MSVGRRSWGFGELPPLLLLSGGRSPHLSQITGSLPYLVKHPGHTSQHHFVPKARGGILDGWLESVDA